MAKKNYGWGKNLTNPSEGAKYSRKGKTGGTELVDGNTKIVYKNGKAIGYEEKRKNFYGSDPKKIPRRLLKK